MQRNVLFTILVLMIPTLLAPVARAGPVEESGSVVLDAARHAHAEAVPAALRATGEATNLTLRTHATATALALDTHSRGTDWALRTHGAAVRAAQEGHSAAVTHALDGHALAVRSAERSHGEVLNATLQGSGTALNLTLAGHAAGTEFALGTHAAATYLTEDAYAWAVSNVLIAYPETVVTLRDLMDAGVVTQEDAYGLAFNPLSLAAYLEGTGENDVIAIRAPTPEDAIIQSRGALSGIAEPSPARFAGDPFSPTPASSYCEYPRNRFENKRLFRIVERHSWPAFDANEYGLFGRGGFHFSATPYGEDCDHEYDGWQALYVVKGMPYTKLPIGHRAEMDAYLTLTGAEFEIESPLTGSDASFVFGYGRTMAPAAQRANMRDPTIFLEAPASGFLTPRRDRIDRVAIGNDDITDENCQRGDCPLMESYELFWPLAGTLFEMVTKVKVPMKVKHYATYPFRAAMWSYGYLTSQYYTISELEQKPGAGVRFSSEHAAAMGKTSALHVRIPYDIEAMETESHIRVRFMTGYFAQWLDNDFTYRGTSCQEARKCGSMGGNELHTVGVRFRNDPP